MKQLTTRTTSRSLKWRSLLLTCVFLTVCTMSFQGVWLLQATRDGMGNVDAVLGTLPLLRNVDESVSRSQRWRSLSPWFSVDILSIGSNQRPHFLRAQKNTFAQHLSVRNFFNATEDIDDDQTCEHKLNWSDIEGISRFCRDGKKWDRRRQFVMHDLQGSYARARWLKKKANPTGWMCAQTRPMQALYQVLTRYEDVHQDLPDFLILMDDDTYYNIPLLQRYLQSNYPNSSNPVAIAACLIRRVVSRINSTLPFGGYGLILSKGFLETLIRPIRCHNSTTERFSSICHAILERSQLDEGLLFRDTMSISALMNAYATKQPFVDWRNWTTGFCLHSDWLWGYIANFYNVSDHVNDKGYHSVPQARMRSYLGSEIQEGNSSYPQRICHFQNGNCHRRAQVCHYSTPDEMASITGLVRQQYPDEFPNTNSAEEPIAQPVVDILSLGWVERPHQLEAQRKTMASHPLVRNFCNVTEFDDSSLACRGTLAEVTPAVAEGIIGKCKAHHTRFDSTSAMAQLLQRVYEEELPKREGSNVMAWVCRQRRVIVGLKLLSERYKLSGESLPDYLLVVDDQAYYNMELFPDLLSSVERANKLDLAPEIPLVVSGCVREYKLDASHSFATMQTKFGIILSRDILKSWIWPFDFTNTSSPNGPTNYDGSEDVPSLVDRLELQTRLGTDIRNETNRRQTTVDPWHCTTEAWLLTWMIHSHRKKVATNFSPYDPFLETSSNSTDLHVIPFLDSIAGKSGVGPMCLYDNELCHEDSFYCGGVTSEKMYELKRTAESGAGR